MYQLNSRLVTRLSDSLWVCPLVLDSLCIYMVNLFVFHSFIFTTLVKQILCFHCRVLALKKAAQEKAHAERVAAAASFKSLLRDKGDITVDSRWSRVCSIMRKVFM